MIRTKPFWNSSRNYNESIENLRNSLITGVASGAFPGTPTSGYVVLTSKGIFTIGKQDAPSETTSAPNIPLHPYTQTKLKTLLFLQVAAGSPPGEQPVVQIIPYRRLRVQILEWLEHMGIPARRHFAPFSADWSQLFEGGKRLPIEKNAQKFYDHLIHCLLVEVQLVLNQFYFEKLQLTSHDIPISLLADFVHPEEILWQQKEKMTTPNIQELYARNFLDFHIIMVRALWDKVVQLACIAFDVEPKGTRNSVDDRLKNLKSLGGLTPLSKPFIEIFLGIAQEQLKDKDQGGWLRAIRDHLIHDTGQHSFGVLPQKKSLESSFELWNRIKDEHSWLREAMMALLATLLIRGWIENKKD